MCVCAGVRSHVHVSFHVWGDQCVCECVSWRQLGPVPLSVQSRLCVWALQFCYLVSCSQCCTLKLLFACARAFSKMCHTLTLGFWNYYSSLACCFDWRETAHVCVWEHVHVCEISTPCLQRNCESQLLVLSIDRPPDSVGSRSVGPLLPYKNAMVFVYYEPPNILIKSGLGWFTA